MKKKNCAVVYIITKLELGGAQKVCLSLFNGIHEKDVPTFLISGTSGPLVRQVRNNARAVLLPSLERDVSIAALFSEFKAAYAIYKTLKKLKASYPHLIVHTHSTKAGITGRWAAWCAGISSRIHTVHGYAFHDHQSWFSWLPIFFIEWITAWITTHFICVSAHDAKIGIRLLPRFSNRHTIIRAAVDQEMFYKPAHLLRPISRSQSFIFGTISCFKPQKNLIDLLKAFEKVYQENNRARLEIIGDGVQRPMLEAWIAQHNLHAAITLHGWVEHVTPLIEQWHCFTLSSLWEGLPCAIIEARLQHLPVVCYKTGGIPEIIDERNGILIAPGDWHGLAAGMKRMMDEHTRYRSMQHFKDDLEPYYKETMITEHIKLYHTL